MSTVKTLAHRTESVKGSLKKMAGRLTGSRRMRAEGRGDQAKGKMKQAGTKVKNAFKR